MVGFLGNLVVYQQTNIMPTYTNPDPTEPKKNLVIGLIVAAAVIGGFFYCTECIDTLKLRKDIFTTVPDFLTKYLLVVIAVERSASIYVNIFRKREENKWLKRIARVSRAVEGENVTDTYIRQLYKKENVILDDLDPKTTILPKHLAEAEDKEVKSSVKIEEVKGYLDSVLRIYQFKLSDYQSDTKRKASYLVFGGGIVLAFFGISILGDLVYLPNMDECMRLQCIGIRLFDILVTGGLLGGGSASFNKFIHIIQSAIPNADPNTQSTL